MSKPTFFPAPADFRAWLEKHHDQARELLVGFHKKGSGLDSITWPESVDEALSFGWIDGVRKRFDETSYTIRFTPRKPGSNWSAVNVARVEVLSQEGRMQPAGLKAFAGRSEARTAIYAYEQKDNASLEAAEEEQFRAHPQAWEFFQSQAPSYRRTCIWWIVNAKKEETRKTRLARLIDSSAQGKRL